MKKILLTIACVAVFSGAMAQNFEWGVKAGLNLANMSNVDDSKMKPSFNVGVFGEYRFNDFIGIQPEIMFSRQGWYEKEGGDKAWAKFEYINVPILAKIYLIDALSLEVGPQFGFLIDSKFKHKANGVTTKGDIVGTKDFDISVGMGLSYQITYNLSVNARYNLGLTKVNDQGNDKMKNNVIQVGLGWKF